MTRTAHRDVAGALKMKLQKFYTAKVNCMSQWITNGYRLMAMVCLTSQGPLERWRLMTISEEKLYGWMWWPWKCIPSSPALGSITDLWLKLWLFGSTTTFLSRPQSPWAALTQWLCEWAYGYRPLPADTRPFQWNTLTQGLSISLHKFSGITLQSETLYTHCSFLLTLFQRHQACSEVFLHCL